MPTAHIAAIEYYLPESVLDNDALASQFPEWTSKQIEQKTGIRRRHIAKAGETSVDLAVAAGERLFRSGKCSASDVDFVLLCTQSPDYFLPTSACIVQHRLGILTSAGALDINLGCSGFVYGLSLAKGLIETGAAKTVLLLTSETYSKFLDPSDKSVRTIFGDGAAATLVRGGEGQAAALGPFVFGTDGGRGDRLIVEAGGMRLPLGEHEQRRPTLVMDGPSIFSFTLQVVPLMINGVLEKAGLTLDSVDFVVLHQANRFMLDALRKQSTIPESKFVYDLAEQGNTVSSTIPIALANLARAKRFNGAARVLLVGFGVGLSWAATLATVSGEL